MIERAAVETKPHETGGIVLPAPAGIGQYDNGLALGFQTGQSPCSAHIICFPAAQHAELIDEENIIERTEFIQLIMGGIFMMTGFDFL